VDGGLTSELRHSRRGWRPNAIWTIKYHKTSELKSVAAVACSVLFGSSVTRDPQCFDMILNARSGWKNNVKNPCLGIAFPAQVILTWHILVVQVNNAHARRHQLNRQGVKVLDDRRQSRIVGLKLNFVRADFHGLKAGCGHLLILVCWDVPNPCPGSSYEKRNDDHTDQRRRRN
jgi:hypothetical protein